MEPGLHCLPCSYANDVITMLSKQLRHHTDFKVISSGCHSVKVLSTTVDYRKNSKNWDTLNYYCDCHTNGIVGFYSAILRSKDVDRITNRVDTDQTAP